MTKKELRKELHAIRNQIEIDSRKSKEAKIRQAIFSDKRYHDATDLLCYVSFGSEVETISILEQMLADGKQVFVPRVISDIEMVFHQIQSLKDLESGSYGILEPNSSLPVYEYHPEHTAVMYLPGLGFDQKHFRIGYGKGYYDHYLISLKERPLFNQEQFHTIGIAFEEQILEELPVEPHDQPLEEVFYA